MKPIIALLFFVLFVYATSSDFFDDTPIIKKTPTQSEAQKAAFFDDTPTPKTTSTVRSSVNFNNLREIQKQDSIQKVIAKHVADSIAAAKWERERPMREELARQSHERALEYEREEKRIRAEREQARQDKIDAENQAREERREQMRNQPSPWAAAMAAMSSETEKTIQQLNANRALNDKLMAMQEEQNRIREQREKEERENRLRTQQQAYDAQRQAYEENQAKSQKAQEVEIQRQEEREQARKQAEQARIDEQNRIAVAARQEQIRQQEESQRRAKEEQIALETAKREEQKREDARTTEFFVLGTDSAYQWMGEYKGVQFYIRSSIEWGSNARKFNWKIKNTNTYRVFVSYRLYFECSPGGVGITKGGEGGTLGPGVATSGDMSGQFTYTPCGDKGIPYRTGLKEITVKRE